jgi:hypothetical protein
MKRLTLLTLALFSALLLFPPAGAANGEAPAPLGPDYAAHPPASDAAALADAQKFYKEGSYQWALAAALELARRWPDSPSRAEGDFIAVRCYFQLDEKQAEADAALRDYLRAYGKGPFAADAADLLVDAYSESRNLYDSYGWQSYLGETYGYSFYGGEKGRRALDRKRRAVLKQVKGIYNGLAGAAPDATTRERLQDRLVLEYLIMYPYFDWAGEYNNAQRAYDARASYLAGVAALPQSRNMASVVAVARAALDFEALPLADSDWTAAGLPPEQYDAWASGKRLDAARAAWSRIAEQYGDAPGGLFARAALAHYDVTYFDEVNRAAAAFDELAAAVGDDDYAGVLKHYAQHLRLPALAITGVRADPDATPPVAVELGCRLVTDVELTLYEADPTQYLALKNKIAGVEANRKPAPTLKEGEQLGSSSQGLRAIPTTALPGVGKEVARWTVATGCAPDDYRLKNVVATRDELPLGLYVVEARAGDEFSRALFLYTRAGALAASDGEELYLQPVNARTGEPTPFEVAGAFNVYYAPDARGYSTERTTPVALNREARADGVVLDLTKYQKNSTLFLVLTSPLGPAVYSCSTAYNVRPKAAAAGTFITDRPLYRPGDKVSFKAIVRNVDYVAKALAPVARQNLELFAYSPDGQEIWKGTAVTDEFGTAAGNFTPPPGVKLGTFNLVARWKVGDKENSVSGSFDLEEYEKPEYEISATPRKRFYLSGEKVDVDVVGKYYFGAPMAGAAVTYDVYREGYTPKGYDYDKVLKHGTATLDAEGRFTLSFATPWAKKFDNYFTVNFHITDLSQHVVEESAYFSTYKTDRYVSLGLDKNEYRPGEPVRMTLSAYDWENIPVPNAGVTVAAYEYLWDAETGYYRGARLYEGGATTDADGAATLEARLTTPPPDVEFVAAVTGTNGATYETSATCAFVGETELTTVRKPEIGVSVSEYYPKVGDEITVNLESRFDDADCLLVLYSGRIVALKHVKLTKAELGSAASFQLPVDVAFAPRMTIMAEVVKDGTSWNASASLYITNPHVEMKVAVSSSQAEYRPGAEATVTVACTDPGGAPVPADMSLAVVDSSLLAVRPDRTYAVPSTFENSLDRYGYVQFADALSDRGYIGNAVYWFPYYPFLYGAYAMNFVPALTAWGPATDALRRISLPGLIKPELERWAAVADADLLDRERRRTLWGGGHYGGWGYGEGLGGMGAGGALGAAEEPGMMMRSAASPAATKEAYATDMLVAGDFEKSKKLEADETTGEDKADRKGKDGGIVQPVLRKEFLDVALWLPNVRTDAAGVAGTTFKLPDNLTEWRVMALALDAGQRFGWGNAAFNVNKYIIARLKAPRYMVAGDVARLTAFGHNYLKEEKELTVKIDVEGLTPVKGDNTLTQKVPADGQAVLYEWVEAGASGRARLVTSALTDTESDAAELFVPIYPHGSQIRQAFGGRLRDDVTHKLTVLDNITAGSFTAELFVTPSLAQTLSHGLDYFKDYPYDCVEQTLNRFRVNALLAAAAADLKLDQTKLGVGLDAAIAAGVTRLAEQQTNEGGWPWWKGGRESPYMTAYALDGLAALRGNPFVAAPSGTKIDEMYAKAAEHLKRYIREWQSSRDRYPSALSLYVADVALRTGIVPANDEAVNELARYYFNWRSPHDDMSNALLASVLLQLGKDQELAVVLRNIDNGAKRGADNTLHWGADPDDCWRWWDDSVEATAKVLEVKLAAQPDNPQLPYLVDWLVDQRRGAAWKSTKDSAGATTALIRYILAHPELAAPIVTSYTVGHKEGTLELDPTAYEKPGENVSFAPEDFAVGDNPLTLHRQSGAGPVFYTMAVEYYTTARDIPAIQGSVTLERAYYLITRQTKGGRVKEKRTPLTRAVKPGDEIEVALTVKSPYDFDYVILEDPKPAGFINLETASGYNWYLDAYVELWNKQRSIMFERLKAGKTEIRYRLRAEVPGTYAALPARIYGMYAPDIGSNTASVTVEVAEE